MFRKELEQAGRQRAGERQRAVVSEYLLLVGLWATFAVGLLTPFAWYLVGLWTKIASLGVLPGRPRASMTRS